MSTLFSFSSGLDLTDNRLSFYAILAGVIAAHILIGIALVNFMPSERLPSLLQSAQPMNVRLIDIKPEPTLPVPVKPLAKSKHLLPTPARIVAVNTPVPKTAPGGFAVPPPQAESPIHAVPPAPTYTPLVVAARFDAAYLNNPKPIYPAASRRLGEEGKVVLRVHVDAGGQAETVEIRTSSGFHRLDSAAHEAVALWRFVPARRGDEPVSSWVLVPIVFNLES